MSATDDCGVASFRQMTGLPRSLFVLFLKKKEYTKLDLCVLADFNRFQLAQFRLFSFFIRLIRVFDNFFFIGD